MPGVTTKNFRPLEQLEDPALSMPNYTKEYSENTKENSESHCFGNVLVLNLNCQNPTQLRKCVGVRHSSHVYPTTPPHAQTFQPLLDQLESCNLAQTLIALGFDN